MAEHINIKAVLPVSIKPLQSKEIIFMLNNITQKKIPQAYLWNFLIFFSFLTSYVTIKKELLTLPEKGYKALVYLFSVL